jgi:hypothetical protein
MPAATTITGKGAVRVEHQPAGANPGSGLAQFIEGERQLLGVMPEQSVEDPLLKSFSVKLPLLVNLVLAALGPQAFQTLEVTPRSELGTQLGRLRATGKRHPASGAASLGIPAIGQQVKMPQNPLDDAAVFDEGDDFRLGPAIEAGQGVGFPYLRNEPAPLGGGGRTIRFGRCRAVPDLCRLPFSSYAAVITRASIRGPVRRLPSRAGRRRSC